MKKLILASVALLAACGGAEAPSRAHAALLTNAQRSQIGKRCASDLECDPALVCTDRLSPDTGPECAFAVASTLECPAGYEHALAMDGNVGAPVAVGQEGDVPVTGHFCIPLCATGKDCSNAQCCLLFGGAAAGGSCTTRDPRNAYSNGLVCR
jgi:hypothetical protein